MSVFGDHDPEDAYDPGDPLDVRAALVGRVLLSIIAERRATGYTARVAARHVVWRRILARIDDELLS